MKNVIAEMVYTAKRGQASVVLYLRSLSHYYGYYMLSHYI